MSRGSMSDHGPVTSLLVTTAPTVANRVDGPWVLRDVGKRIEFVLDGQRLGDLVADTEIGPLEYEVTPFEDLTVDGPAVLWGKELFDADAQDPSRVPLLLCSCGDLMCGALTMRVSRDDDKVSWSDWAWEELFAFVRTATQTPVGNPLMTPYWSMGAVRHGDHVAKIRVAPTADSMAGAIHRELDLTSGPEVFGPALADELRARPFDFDLQVQLCTDLETMPVNDLTVDYDIRIDPANVGDHHLWSFGRKANCDSTATGESGHPHERCVVAACNNVDFLRPEWPGYFATAITVNMARTAEDSRFWYKPGTLVEFAARGVNVDVAWKGGRTKTVTGSSYAAPRVAGLLACMLSARSELKPLQAKALLHAIADPWTREVTGPNVTYSD